MASFPLPWLPNSIQLAFSEILGEVKKAYLALVTGTLPQEHGEINAKLRSFQTVDRYRAVVHPYGKEAITVFQRLAVLQGVTWFSFPWSQGGFFGRVFNFTVLFFFIGWLVALFFFGLFV